MAGDHHHLDPEAGDGRVLWAVVNLLLTVAQIIGGVLSGSLALIADAIHTPAGKHKPEPLAASNI